MASHGDIHSFIHHRYSKIYNELNAKINDILIFDKDIPPKAAFTFVDFASNFKYNTKEQLTSSKVCKNYCDVVERANIWLSENINWRVVGCETVNATMRVTNDLEYHHYDKEQVNYLTPLILFRLWLTKREDLEIENRDELIIQRIKYLDFIPERIKGSHDQFEDLDSVIKRINEKIKNGEIKGPIINIQTYSCEAGNDWSVNPEDTTPKFFKKYVFVIRVFYEIGLQCDDEIVFMDFVPECHNKINIFSAPKFESQSDTFKRCSLWLSENTQLSICNVQTIESKINSRTKIDTKCMSFSQNKSEFIRIIRVVYRKPSETINDTPQIALPSPSPLYLASMSIVLDRSDHKYDEKLIVSNISISKSIIDYFFLRKEWNTNEQYKWKFLNIETTNICAENEKELESRFEKSFRHYYTHETLEHSIFKTTFYVATIYFDVGYYGRDEIDILRAFKSGRTESSRFFPGNHNNLLEKEFKICKIPLKEWEHLWSQMIDSKY